MTSDNINQSPLYLDKSYHLQPLHLDHVVGDTPDHSHELSSTSWHAHSRQNIIFLCYFLLHCHSC